MKKILSVLLTVLLIALLVGVATLHLGGFDITKDKGVTDTTAPENNQLPEKEPVTEPTQAEQSLPVEQEPQAEKQYTMQCIFEGKMDENSFEVTELAASESGKLTEKQILEVRVGNDTVRRDINIAEIGERITVVYSYNADSQLIAERIDFSGE